jgi:hypothetical protein
MTLSQRAKTPLGAIQSLISHNHPVLSGIFMNAPCTSLRLTVPQRNRTLQVLIRGAKLWLALLRSRKRTPK